MPYSKTFFSFAQNNFMKKKIIKVPIILIAVALSSGCAAIFKGTKADVSITSTEENTIIYKVDARNVKTELGVAPCVVTIRKRTPFLVAKKEGFFDEKFAVTANSKFEPIAWLNLLSFGWGYLLVDLPSGAYMKIDKEVNFIMKKQP
jgi:uncharacterized protein YceK